MAKPRSQYVCQDCGAVAAKWAGRCEGCGAWNSLVEETVQATPGGLSGRGKAAGKIRFVDLKSESQPRPRLVCEIAEFDRVTGGGLVPGSAVLVAGDPGIGKSTLLLQVAARMAEKGADCAYISGEESIDQVRLRARRMGLAQAPAPAGEQDGTAAGGALIDGENRAFGAHAASPGFFLLILTSWRGIAAGAGCWGRRPRSTRRWAETGTRDLHSGKGELTWVKALGLPAH